MQAHDDVDQKIDRRYLNRGPTALKVKRDSGHTQQGERHVTIVRIGANKKYSDNWERAFGKSAKKSIAAKANSKRATKRKAKSKSK
jgi:hypothetical protein